MELIAEKLKRESVEPWLDKWCLTPGGNWQYELATGLHASSACAIFIGPSGIGDWEREELGVALSIAAKDRAFRLFLVLLPGLPEPFDSSTLPPFLSTRTWVDLRSGIEDKRAFQLLINAIKGVSPGPVARVELRNEVCPYRGLQIFDEAHAGFFFGRNADIQRLIEKLKSSRFVAVVGASGSGKSSLVCAGLVPALRKNALPASQTWEIRILTPGAHPLTALTTHLLRLFPQGTMQKTLDQMDADARTLHLAASLALAGRPPAERVVWIIDQLEELFTLCHDDQERTSFFANLLYAASVPDGRNGVVLTLRADFYSRCATYPELSAQMAAQQFLVSQMSEEGLRQAIEEPARRVGLEFEQGLVKTIMDDVVHQPGALPLLEHALFELWGRRRGQMLTLAAYEESGGVRGAIAKRADTIFSGFTPEQQAIVRQIMLRLTEPGEGTDDTRRRAAMSELVTRTDEADQVNNVVRAMTDARLLTMSEEDNSEVVDVSHEALIRGWPRLRHWIDEDRAGLRVHRRLTEAAQEWLQLNRDEGMLYRGAILAQAGEWREKNDAHLNELEREFLDASLALKTHEAEQEKEQQRRELEAAQKIAEAQRRRAESERRARVIQRYFTIGLVVLLLAAAGIAYFAIQQRNISRGNELASEALSQLSIDPERSLLLAIEAAHVAPTAQVEQALKTSLQESRVRAAMLAHTDFVNTASPSPDGRLVVTASNDGTARVWEIGTGRTTAVLRGHTCKKIAERCIGFVTSAKFSPDGKYIVTTGYDGTARVWDAKTGQSVTVLQGHAGPVYTAAFSSDGKLLITAGDNTPRVWEVGTWRLLTVLRGHSLQVFVANFSPNGKFAVTAGQDHAAILWEIPSGKQLAILPHEGEVTSAAFSPDSRLVVTSSWDHTARIWESATGKSITVLRGHMAAVRSAVFSSDGRFVLTASEDGMARLWETSTGRSLVVYNGDANDRWTSATFSSNDAHIVTASWGGVVRVWDTATGRREFALHGHTNRVSSAWFSQDGRYVVTSSWDKTARVWDISGTGECRGCKSIEDLLALARTRVTRQLTCEERKTYMNENITCSTLTPNP